MMEPPILHINPPDESPKDEIKKLVLANKGTILYFVTVLLFIIFLCGQTILALPTVQPAVSVRIMTDYCPSIEVRAGMQIAWINLDEVDRALIVERTIEHGKVMDSGGVGLLQPGDTFAISLNDAGEYTYYCSTNHLVSGTITVLK